MDAEQDPDLQANTALQHLAVTPNPVTRRSRRLVAQELSWTDTPKRTRRSEMLPLVDGFSPSQRVLLLSRISLCARSNAPVFDKTDINTGRVIANAWDDVGMIPVDRLRHSSRHSGKLSIPEAAHVSSDCSYRT